MYPVHFPAASQNFLALRVVQRGGGEDLQSRGEAGLTEHWAAVPGEGLPVGFLSPATSATNRSSRTFHKYVGGVNWGGLNWKGGLC